MIKIYSMNTCPDCIYVEEQIQGDDRYEIIDIGSHVKHLKEFLRIRDSSPVFNEAKKVGAAGISCFVLEDGSVTLIHPHTRRSRTYFKTNYRRNVM